MSTPFIVLALISVAAAVVSLVAVTAYVSGRGVKINYFLWEVMILKYVNDYVEMTSKETGRPGVWYYTLAVSIVLTFIFVAIGFALR